MTVRGGELEAKVVLEVMAALLGLIAPLVRTALPVVARVPAPLVIVALLAEYVRVGKTAPAVEQVDNAPVVPSAHRDHLDAPMEPDAQAAVPMLVAVPVGGAARKELTVRAVFKAAVALALKAMAVLQVSLVRKEALVHKIMDVQAVNEPVVVVLVATLAPAGRAVPVAPAVLLAVVVLVAVAVPMAVLVLRQVAAAAQVVAVAQVVVVKLVEQGVPTAPIVPTAFTVPTAILAKSRQRERAEFR